MEGWSEFLRFIQAKMELLIPELLKKSVEAPEYHFSCMHVKAQTSALKRT